MHLIFSPKFHSQIFPRFTIKPPHCFCIKTLKNPQKDKQYFNRFWKAFWYASFLLQIKLIFLETALIFFALELLLKYACSLNSPWWFSLNGIRASTTLFMKNFSFWWSPYFSAFEPPNNNLIKSRCSINGSWKNLLKRFFPVASPLLSHLAILKK